MSTVAEEPRSPVIDPSSTSSDTARAVLADLFRQSEKRGFRIRYRDSTVEGPESGTTNRFTICLDHYARQP